MDQGAADAFHSYREKRGRDGRKRVQVTVRVPDCPPVTAAGVLPFWTEDGELHTAVLNERMMLGDIGGKVEPSDVVAGEPDATVRNTVEREFAEETGVPLPDGWWDSAWSGRLFFPNSLYACLTWDASEHPEWTKRLRACPLIRVLRSAPDVPSLRRAAAPASLHHRLVE